MAILPSGDVVVVWVGPGGADDLSNLRYRLYDAEGSPLTEVRLVDQNPVSVQLTPVVEARPDGGFVVGWREYDPSGWDPEVDPHPPVTYVRGRLFDGAGDPRGAAFEINAVGSANSGATALDVFDDGRMIVTWYDNGVGTERAEGIQARLLAADGTPEGGQFVLSQPAGGAFLLQGDVEVLADGDFLAAWGTRELTPESDYLEEGIMTRRFSAEGEPRGPQQALDLPATPDGRPWSAYDHVSPAIEALPGGGWLLSGGLSYESPDSPGDFTDGVFVQRFDAQGRTAGETWSALQDGSGPRIGDPGVTALDDGGWLLRYAYDVSGGWGPEFPQTRLLRFDPDGQPVDDVARLAGDLDRITVNMDSDIEQLDDGRLVAVWERGFGFGSENDIRMRFYAAEVLGTEAGDRMVDRAGGQRFDGREGVDTLLHLRAEGRVLVDLQADVSGADFARFFAAGAAAGDTYAGIENLVGGAFADNLRGDAGVNVLQGGGVSDRLYGRAGDDRLLGGTGADALYGNLGADVMTGGDDVGRRDRFIYFQAEESRPGAGNRDVITDFVAGEDRIEISRLDADTTRGFKQAFDWVGDAALDAAGQLGYRHEAGNTIVQADFDGDGAADFEIELSGVMDLSADDFLI
ncbi:Alkaline phosphatase [Salipiger mucosus DSM 16094]|uniref:Alkaline phosphatase n=1 Tax=Salipiger mucosus DSM 16094 TaxID=1123237 RepID=S9QWD7_9RHOB|nr:Alkaline phosphatase [Salipiger mucosus DSM 16094]